MSKIVRSIDIGYGNVKYIESTDETGAIVTNHFPSYVVPKRNNKISGGHVSSRNTVPVVVNGHEYEVGPDILRACDTQVQKPLNSDYVNTNEFLALALGSLYCINESKIDLLVTGLPVSHLRNHASNLHNLLIGSKKINGKEIFINDVKVIAQPLGSFIDHTLQRGLYGTYREQTILVVDIGFFTCDWIVTQGLNIFDARSSSYPGGMNMILKSISERISEDLNISFTQLLKLDEGLRTKRLSLNGQVIDPTQYLAHCKPYLERTIHAISENLGDTSDIEQIFLAGGGAPYFSKVIKEHFQGRNVHIVNDPMFSNVRGFQRIGQQIMKSNSKA